MASSAVISSTISATARPRVAFGSRLGAPALPPARRAALAPRPRGIALSRRSAIVAASSSPVDTLKGALGFYPPLFYSVPFQAVTVPSVLSIAYLAFGNSGILDGDLLQVAQIAATAIGFVHLASGAGAAYIASEKDVPVPPAVAKNLLIGFPAFLEILLKED